MAELQSIIVLRGPHFVHHLGICNRILCQTSATHVRYHYAQFSEKNEVAILINSRVTANYSASWSPFCPPSLNLKSDLCQTLTDYVRCYSIQF